MTVAYISSMKRWWTLLFLWYCSVGMAQVNLVPNPSFEDHFGCPDNWSQLNLCDGWTACKGSPDYYNSCGSQDSFSVPSNFMGYQNAANGTAYCGIIMYDKSGFGLDEIIGTQLNQSLTVGIRYYVTFKVVWKYNNQYSICCSHNKIGALFSTSSYSASLPPQLNNAQVYEDNIVSDTANWYSVFGSFLCDSAYSFMMIGNFFDDSLLSIIDISPSSVYSYYYIDEVCVSDDSNFTANYATRIGDCNSDNGSIVYPNPCSNYVLVSLGSSENFSFHLYNSDGQIILDLQCHDTTTIDLQDLTPGLYFIELRDEKRAVHQKLIKTQNL